MRSVRPVSPFRLSATGIVAAACLALSSADAGAATPRHYISPILADISLNSSPWSKRNDAVGGCKGLGPMRTDINRRKLYASFRCTMTDGVETPRGVVVVVTTGPESVRVSRVESGELSAHVPIKGVASTVRPRLRSVDAGPFVERSTWARDKELFGVLCFGVGRYRETQGGTLFGSFVCKVRILGSEPAIVLVRAQSDRTVRVVATLA